MLLSTASTFAQMRWSATDRFPADIIPSYFPVDVFAEGKSDGDSTARWFAYQLRALGEPTLSGSPFTGQESVYRFTWLRSFDHPVTVRITVHANGTGTFTARMANGAPGHLIANITREVSRKDVRHVLDLIEAVGFWAMPPEPTATVGADGSYTVNLDGAQWILEASSHGVYHVIDHWSPNNGPLRELGLYLAITLGKLDIPAKTIY